MIRDGYKIAEFRSWGNGSVKQPNALSLARAMPKRSEYTIDEWTEREEGYGPLTCFTDLKYLWEFLLSCSEIWTYTKPYRFILPRTWVIFKCEWLESREMGLWAPNGSNTPWKLTPMGTMFADEIKILGTEVDLPIEYSYARRVWFNA